jgi:outer membrane phospholipase A
VISISWCSRFNQDAFRSLSLPTLYHNVCVCDDYFTVHSAFQQFSYQLQQRKSAEGKFQLSLPMRNPMVSQLLSTDLCENLIFWYSFEYQIFDTFHLSGHRFSHGLKNTMYIPRIPVANSTLFYLWVIGFCKFAFAGFMGRAEEQRVVETKIYNEYFCS